LSLSLPPHRKGLHESIRWGWEIFLKKLSTPIDATLSSPAHGWYDRCVTAWGEGWTTIDTRKDNSCNLWCETFLLVTRKMMSAVKCYQYSPSCQETDVFRRIMTSWWLAGNMG
jgi:hypothetical protein